MLPRRAFYFIRHGRTHANEQQLMCGGGWDVPLLPHGQEQARRAALALSQHHNPPQVLWVSPMLRARQTAEILNEKLGRAVFTHEGLREWLIGDWEEQPWHSIPNPFVENIDPPNGEARATFTSRVVTALCDVFGSTEELPLIVAHGAVAHVLFSSLGISETLIENCATYYVSPAEHCEKSWLLHKVA